MRASVLYLPVAEGGQGLIDIISRTVAFRLQVLQRLLYGSSLWTATAQLLLMKAGGLGFDRQLFLMRTSECDLSGLTPFYGTVVEAWRTLSYSRSPDHKSGWWVFEEPIFFNSFLTSSVLSSQAMRSSFISAGITRLGHLTASTVKELAEATGVRSTRVLHGLQEEVWQSLLPSLMWESGKKRLDCF